MSESDRLRWRCRRGTLELDLILTRFLERHYSGLAPADQRWFEALLQLQDDELQQLILGTGDAPPAHWTNVIDRLRLC